MISTDEKCESCESCEKYWQFKFCPVCGKNILNGKNLEDVKSRKQIEILNTVIVYKNTPDLFEIDEIVYDNLYTVRDFLEVLFNYRSGISCVKIKSNNKNNEGISDKLKFYLNQLGEITLYCSHLEKEVFIENYLEAIENYKKEHYIFGINNIFSEIHTHENITFRYMRQETDTYLKRIWKISNTELNILPGVDPSEAISLLLGFKKI